MKKLMILSLKTMFTFCIIALVGCETDTTRRGADGMMEYRHMDGPVVEILIQDNQYHPGDLTVEAGTNVRWMNEDEVEHTVTALDGSFGSEGLSHGATFTHHFDKAGTYHYNCNNHPEMRGSIIVE